MSADIRALVDCGALDLRTLLGMRGWSSKIHAECETGCGEALEIRSALVHGVELFFVAHKASIVSLVFLSYGEAEVCMEEMAESWDERAIEEITISGHAIREGLDYLKENHDYLSVMDISEMVGIAWSRMDGVLGDDDWSLALSAQTILAESFRTATVMLDLLAKAEARCKLEDDNKDLRMSVQVLRREIEELNAQFDRFARKSGPSES